MSETIKEETAEAVQAEPQGLTLEKFEEATEVVSKVISETKLVYSEYFSNLTGNKVYLKPENMQYTGAYKVRGAFYKISTLSDEEKQRGLITASAGNHAQGVAYAAKLAGCKRWFFTAMYSMRRWHMQMSWQRSTDIPLSIRSTIWT